MTNPSSVPSPSSSPSMGGGKPSSSPSPSFPSSNGGGSKKKVGKAKWGSYVVVMLSIALIVAMFRYIPQFSPGFIRPFVPTLLALIIFPIVGFMALKYGVERGAWVLMMVAAAWGYGMSVEGYWQVIDPNAPSFIIKPGIKDDANMLLLISPKLWADPNFWFAAISSLFIQMMQAKGIRVIWNTLKPFSTKTANPSDEQKRKALFWGIGISLTYVVDFFFAIQNYPVLPWQDFDRDMLFINIFYLIASVFFAEVMFTLAEGEDE